MAITGEHLITFGRQLEQEKTKEAEKRAETLERELEDLRKRLG